MEDLMAAEGLTTTTMDRSAPQSVRDSKFEGTSNLTEELEQNILPYPTADVSSLPEIMSSLSISAAENHVQGGKTKKQKWTKEMKRARRAAAADAPAATLTADPAASEKNGLEHSPFNKIPAELRNEIYELVLDVPEVIYINGGYRCAKGGKRIRQKKTLPVNNLAITKVCHQIRKESTPIFYSINKFALEVRFWRGGFKMTRSQHKALISNLVLLRTWLNQIGPAIESKIPDIMIYIGSWETAFAVDRSERRSWWTGTLQALSRFCSTNNIPKEKLTLLSITSYDPQTLNFSEPPIAFRVQACQQSTTQWQEFIAADLVGKLLHNRSQARKTVEAACSRQLQLIEEHADHEDCLVAKWLPRLRRNLEHARCRMLYTVGSPSATDGDDQEITQGE